ncbi:hypothetical protein J6590_090724 [Homalodisca vitripennis]|nr:hypothetical protein J6590_090724 [Homalodisca vitripennis]
MAPSGSKWCASTTTMAPKNRSLGNRTCLSGDTVVRSCSLVLSDTDQLIRVVACHHNTVREQSATTAVTLAVVAHSHGDPMGSMKQKTSERARYARAMVTTSPGNNSQIKIPQSSPSTVVIVIQEVTLDSERARCARAMTSEGEVCPSHGNYSPGNNSQIRSRSHPQYSVIVIQEVTLDERESEVCPSHGNYLSEQSQIKIPQSPPVQS